MCGSSTIYIYVHTYNPFCNQESFNTNISHQLFDYKITFGNSQHWNTKFKRLFCTQKPVLNDRLKDFYYTKINLSQKYLLYTRILILVFLPFLLQNNLCEITTLNYKFNAYTILFCIFFYRKIKKTIFQQNNIPTFINITF